MNLVPFKRRKLDYNLGKTSSRDDLSETRSDSRPKRCQDDEDGAAYAGGLYKSNMFKLQVDEMLDEVRPNYDKQLHYVDGSLRRLKNLIEGIEDRDALSIPEATKLLHKSHKVLIPFPNPKPDNNAAYKLSYSRPSNINVVGSYALKTMVKSDTSLAVDIVVTMPSSIFEKKDYLDYRYFYKRAYYLACIAAGLQGTAQGEYIIRFEYLNGNTLHPILVAQSESDRNANVEIHIILAAPSGIFLESRLQPTKNTIRPKDGPDGQAIDATPSPFYNASLRSDCNMEPYLKLLHSASNQSVGFRDSCILGRIWLRQRGFGSSLEKGGFGYFEWSALTALLLKGGGVKGHAVLSSGYSSYQMFKAVVQFISATDLAAKPFLYQATDFVPLKSESPMIYDGQRGQNILYKMTPWSYGLLRDEAKISLDMLNDPTFDQFEAAFIIRTNQPLLRYDCIIHLPIPESTPDQVSCDHLPCSTSFGRRVFGVLQEGLMDRVKLISINEPALPSWPVRSAGPSLFEKSSLSVAVVFNPTNIDRLVDHGPSAEEKKKAAKYQKFWGEKAELRRFKDGSILESLVWSPGTTYSIFQEIVTHLIKRHFGTDVSSSLEFTGEEFEKSLPTLSSKSFETLKEAYHGFEKNVRGLEGLPLQLKQLSGISSQLRYSSILPPSLTTCHPPQDPADVMIQFEGSGRWPDDLIAIQRTKVAFLLKIGCLLKDSDETITTRLGLENRDHSLRNSAFLDIIYPSGGAFRLRIHNDREQTLLERQIQEKSIDNHGREDAVATLAIYKRLYVQLPLHTQSITTHCTRFPLLSPTIRLVKTWFDRHLLTRHVSEELIELLVVRTFLQAYPWRAPSSAMSGFLRTLLFISRWDWRISPLIVDFTGTMTRKEVASINIRLEAWRKIDPGMNRTVIIAASNHDMTGTAFTDKGPSKMAAARLTALARSACKLVKEKGHNLDQRSLFASSTNDYDFVIHLASKFTGKNWKQSSQQREFKNLEVQSDINLDLVGYDPVQLYINELENLYGSSVIFFHSVVAGPVITGLWNPQNVPRPFKVNLPYTSKPAIDTASEDREFIEIDKSMILSEISRIGADMVSRIEVNR